MLPGKKFGPEDLIAIVRRHFWFLIVPLALATAVAAIVARKLPPRYHAEALVMVVPQKVPESFVKSTVTTRLEDRLDTIQQTILSRTKLEKIITDLNLYPEERRSGIMQDVVERMQTRDLKVNIFKGDAFKVIFEGPDPQTTVKVTDQLASLFINESLSDRTSQSEGTSTFLQTELEDARRRLIEQEKLLEGYKTKWSGQLPSQVQANLQALQNTQMQIQNLNDAINHALDRRTLAQQELVALQSAPDPQQPNLLLMASGTTNPSTVATDASGAPSDAPTADRLAMAKSALTMLKSKGLKDAHPDVQRMQGLVSELQKKLNEEELQRPVSADDGLTPVERRRQRRIAQINDDMASLDKQIEAAKAEESRLRQNGTEYQRRIDAEPARESDLVELTRDYDTLQTIYRQLLTQKEQSNISANLERLQQGEQFNLLDPAHLPERPISPNKPAITLMGAGIGLGIGLALIVLLEYGDSTFRHTGEIRDVLQVPVLAVVPFMQSDDERRRSFKRRWMVRLALSMTVMGCLAVVAYTLIR